MAVIFSWLITDLVFAAVVCLALSSLYYARVFKYWRKRGVFYLKPKLFFGNFARVAFHRETPAELLRKVYERTAGHPLVGIYAFRKPQLVIRDLDLVQSVLEKDAQVFLDRDFSPPEHVRPVLSRSVFQLKGRKWRHTKMKLSPAFTVANIRNMLPSIDKRGKELVRYIEKEILQGNAVDVKDVAERFSTDVIASCAFGVDTSALAEPSRELHLAMLEVIEPGVMHKLVLALSLCLPWVLSVIGAVAFPGRVDQFVRMNFWDLVAHRKETGRTVRKDIGHPLPQDEHAGDADASFPGNTQFGLSLDDGDGDGDAAVSQAFVLMLASFATSASVFTFTLFELALRPAVQDRLRGEMMSVLGRSSCHLTHEALAKMTYLDMVVSESMRKYPILPALERKCLTDYKIPGTNITIEKGMAVMIPLLGIHRDPRIYPDPEKFDPERFNSENKRKRSQFAHLPLGEGPMKCTGMQFGRMQAKTALVHVLTNFRVWPCPLTPRLPLKTRAFHGPLSPDKKIVLAFAKLK